MHNEKRSIWDLFWCAFNLSSKPVGRERGPQKSSSNFVSETGRSRVQISLWFLWKGQSTILALFRRRILGSVRRPLVLPARLFYCWQPYVSMSALGRNQKGQTKWDNWVSARFCGFLNFLQSQRTPWGVGKKRGEENLTNDTPPKKGFWTPRRTVRFPAASGVSALFFLYKNPRQSRPEALLEGSKNFRERAFSGTFSSLHTFCTAPYHSPILQHSAPSRCCNS